MPNGLPQTQPVWFERAGNDILVNTTLERRKGRNLAADRRATVLILDPDDSSRWIELRGDAELTEVGAEDHLERLAHRYTGHGYYGPIYPRSATIPRAAAARPPPSPQHQLRRYPPTVRADAATDACPEVAVEPNRGERLWPRDARGGRLMVEGNGCPTARCCHEDQQPPPCS